MRFIRFFFSTVVPCRSFGYDEYDAAKISPKEAFSARYGICQREPQIHEETDFGQQAVLDKAHFGCFKQRLLLHLLLACRKIGLSVLDDAMTHPSESLVQVLASVKKDEMNDAEEKRDTMLGEVLV